MRKIQYPTVFSQKVFLRDRLLKVLLELFRKLA